MAKQSYPHIKVPSGQKKSLAQLFSDAGLTAPTGEVGLEIQNIDTTQEIRIFFGDQTGLEGAAGSPVPPMWAREEVEDFTNVYILGGGSDSFISVLVVS